MHPRNKFIALLEELGICRGDLVFLHTSYSRLKHFELTPEALLNGVLNLLGPDGTLVLPAYAWNILPGVRPWRGYAAYFEMKPPFDACGPTNIGCIPELFRNRKGVLRSESYWWSVSAYGPMAEAITCGQTEVDHYYGAASSFGRLYKFGVKILGLGVTLNTTSLALIADYQLGQPHIRNVFSSALLVGKVYCLDGREVDTRAHWLLPDVVQHIKPVKVFTGSSLLKNAMRYIEQKNAICFCYRYSDYHAAALLLAQDAMRCGRMPPWLDELPVAGCHA